MLSTQLSFTFMKTTYFTENISKIDSCVPNLALGEYSISILVKRGNARRIISSRENNRLTEYNIHYCSNARCVYSALGWFFTLEFSKHALLSQRALQK